jgi:hypothetical protein
MKKVFVVSLLIPFTLFCSCQKQDSTAEQQLAQRKADLDAREKALDEREKALAERKKSVGAALSGRVSPILPASPQTSAEREQLMRERLAERQRMIERLQKMRANRALQRPQEAVPATEAASPSPSPTPE